MQNLRGVSELLRGPGCLSSGCLRVSSCLDSKTFQLAPAFILGLYIGIMEKKMETTGIKGVGIILGLYWDNGKENGNYYNIWGYIGKKLLPAMIPWKPRTTYTRRCPQHVDGQSSTNRHDNPVCQWPFGFRPDWTAVILPGSLQLQ